MPDGQSSPSDDFVAFGLQPAYGGQPPTFVMPSPGHKGALSAFSFTLDCVQAIRKDAGLLQTTAGVIKLAAARTILAHAATVLVTELFDTAVADMLATVGDTTISSATRALADAKAAKIPTHRERHRRTAEGIMRLAYDQQISAQEKRRGKLGYRWMSRTPDMNLTLRATQMALTIALINSELGDVETTETWCGNAISTGSRYLGLCMQEEKFQVEWHAKQARKPMHPYDWSDPRPEHLRKSLDAARRLVELHIETQRLADTCANLIKGARLRR